MKTRAEIVVCGAGIAGTAAAYHLAVRQGIRDIIIVDEYEPLTLTSDKGTQGYRNWFPGPDDTMVRMVSRSIDLLEETARESGNVFRMNRRGYLFATADEARLAELERTARHVSAFGAGDVRNHFETRDYIPARAEGFEAQPTGADILRGNAAREVFPFLAPETIGAVHVRRAGTTNGVALGTWFLKRAVAAGAEFVRDRVTGVETTGGRVRQVHLASGASIETDRFVIAAGPAVHEVGRMLGVDMPVHHELHSKVTIHDPLGAVPRSAPFVIWSDPVVVNGRTLPGGVHMRPVDLTHGDELYLIWTFETDERPYEWPPRFDDRYVDAVLQGCASMIPAMRPYVGSGASAIHDGGYYCKARENRPLVGPLAVDGAYVIAALSGIGIMSAHACGELLALHVANKPLPDYARWFLPSRYDDPAYNEQVARWGPLVGQL